MANHKSSIKRIRQIEKRRLNNSEKTEAVDLFKKTSAMLDKLAKRRVIHKNKASNLKSKLALHVNKLA